MPSLREQREWKANIDKMIRMNEYEKVHALLESVNIQLKEINDSPIDSTFIPKNPRQSSEAKYNIIMKPKLESQKVRLENKLKELSIKIQQDIADTMQA